MVNAFPMRSASQLRAGFDALSGPGARYEQKVRRGFFFRVVAIVCTAAWLTSSALSFARRPIANERTVYHYCPPLEGKKNATTLRSYKGVRVASATQRIYKKPNGIPGSRNYVVDVGGEGYDDREISDFSIMDYRNRTLFINHDNMTWSMRSSTIGDTYYLIMEPLPLQAIISARGPGWEKVREDASADGYTYPYLMVETLGHSVRRYQCSFDKRILVSPAQKKVLASWAGPIRPNDAIQMVALWLSEHGARMKADRCRRLK
jgi:hypothetical protein